MKTGKLLYALAVLACCILVPYLRLYRSKGEAASHVQPPGFIWRAIAIMFAVPTLAYFSGFPKIDDVYIYARYIGNALSGHGLVYNLNEHVNALSSPLFGYLLLFTAAVLHGHIILATEVLSGICLLLASLMAEWLMPFAGILLATSAYFYALTGMETSLFALCMLVEVALYLKGKYKWLPLASVFVALTRFEGAILVAVVAYQIIRQRKLPKLIYFVPALLLVAVYLLLNREYYGAYLPSSAIAKLGQGFSGYWGKWPRAWLSTEGTSWLHTFYNGVIYATPVLLGLALSATLKKSNRLLNQVVLPFCAILFLIYTVMNTPGDYFWYLSPFLVFAIVYAASGVPQTRWGYALAGLFLCFNLFAAAMVLRNFTLKSYVYDYVDAGEWFRHNTPKTASIGAVEIGILGWSSDRYIYDVIGLTTPKNAAYVTKHDSVSWLAEDRPDYVFVHALPWVWETPAVDNQNYFRLPLKLKQGDYILQRKDYHPGPAIPESGGRPELDREFPH